MNGTRDTGSTNPTGTGVTPISGTRPTGRTKTTPSGADATKEMQVKIVYYNCDRDGHVFPNCIFTIKTDGLPTNKEKKRLQKIQDVRKAAQESTVAGTTRTTLTTLPSIPNPVGVLVISMATAGVIDIPTDSDSDLEDSEDNIGTTGVDTDKEEEPNIETTGVVTEAPCRSSRGQILDTGRKHPVEDEYQYFEECLIQKMMAFSHRKRYAKLQFKMNIATSSMP